MSKILIHWWGAGESVLVGRERGAGEVKENSFQVERTVLLLTLGSWANHFSLSLPVYKIPMRLK